MRLKHRFVAVAVLALTLGCGTDRPTAVDTPNMARSTVPLATTKNLNQPIDINVLLVGPATPAQLAELATFGNIQDQIAELNAVLMRVNAGDLATIQALPYVAAANPDQERDGSPVDAVAVSDFTGGLNTWNLDAINVTNIQAGPDRTTAFTGNGVYIGVLDTGLLDSWRIYFPQERIASQYGTTFVSRSPQSNAQPTNLWEHDQNSHGTHVTSTILGYQIGAATINGVAPRATIIPVKVLNQNGRGWSSAIARGILYIAALHTGPLAGHPMVINMSLGGGGLDALERAAIDFAIARGVIIVAAAGNSGDAGMDYPGAYAPVISAGASGWIGEWTPVGNGSWWFNRQVADPTSANDFYVTTFSGRARTGQDLDVLAPGSWVVGPFQLNSGNLRPTYYFLGGTSMATPHVAGIVALMAEKDGALTASQAEGILESTAIPLPAGSRTIFTPEGTTTTVSWGTNATGAGLATADAALAATP